MEMQDQSKAQPPEDVLIRLPEVLRLIPVSAATIWRMVARGELPKPIALSKRIVAWKKSSILACIDQMARG